ncbi:MAG: CBS domain-containing protein [Actinomycetota bacterium]
MSPRAAWRLESLGFPDVYHYVAGVADWAAAGLPLEGDAATVTTAGNVATKQTAVCAPNDPVGEVAARAASAGEDSCLVVNEHQIVLGRLYYKDLEGAPDALVADVMDPGPSTFRPNVPAEEIAEFMRQKNLKTTPITTSDGKYVGMLHLDAAKDLAVRER